MSNTDEAIELDEALREIAEQLQKTHKMLLICNSSKSFTEKLRQDLLAQYKLQRSEQSKS